MFPNDKELYFWNEKGIVDDYTNKKVYMQCAIIASNVSLVTSVGKNNKNTSFHFQINTVLKFNNKSNG